MATYLLCPLPNNFLNHENQLKRVLAEWQLAPIQKPVRN